MDFNGATIPKRKPSLAMQVYGTLKRAIMDNNLQPGAVLLERQLAESLGGSRTPVREALQMLAKDGLVKLVPNREAEVADISILDVKEIIQIRSRLETLAAYLATENAEESDIRMIGEQVALMEESLDKETTRGSWARPGNACDHTLCCGNSRLESILTSLREQISRLTFLSVGDTGQARESMEHHRRVFEAIAAKDPGRAESEMAVHIENIREHLYRRFGL